MSVLPTHGAGHDETASWFRFAQASLRVLFSKRDSPAASKPGKKTRWWWGLSAEGAYGRAGIGELRGM